MLPKVGNGTRSEILTSCRRVSSYLDSTAMAYHLNVAMFKIVHSCFLRTGIQKQAVNQEIQRDSATNLCQSRCSSSHQSVNDSSFLYYAHDFKLCRADSCQRVTEFNHEERVTIVKHSM